MEAVGIAHSATRALVVLGEDAWGIVGVPVHARGVQRGPFKFFDFNLGKPCLYRPHIMHRDIVMLEQV